MFYCDGCAEKYDWKKTDDKSFGLCECCEIFRGLCNEQHHGRLKPIHQVCTETWHSPVILESGICPLCSEIEKHIGSVRSNNRD